MQSCLVEGFYLGFYLMSVCVCVGGSKLSSHLNGICYLWFVILIPGLKSEMILHAWCDGVVSNEDVA